MMKLAIIGTAGAAREVLDALIEKNRSFDAEVLVAKAQVREKIDCIDRAFEVKTVDEAKADDYDLAVFVGDEHLAKEYAHSWVGAGVKVINATEALSDYAEIPWVIADMPIKGYKIVNAIHGVSLPVVKAIYALRNFKVKSVKLTVLCAADIAGQDGMSELYNHTRRILMNDNPSDRMIFPKTLAFNVIPQTGAFIGEETEYEWQTAVDLKRIVGAKVKVHANFAVVPVFVGTGAFVNVEFAQEAAPEDIREVLKKCKGFLVVDTQKDGGYAALTDVQGERDIFVSRIRQDGGSEKGVSFWIASDCNKVVAADLVELIVKMLKKEVK